MLAFSPFAPKATMRDQLRRTPAHIILVCALETIVDITLTWFTDL